MVSKELPIIRGFNTVVEKEEGKKEEKSVVKKEEPEAENRLNKELDDIRDKIDNLKF